MTRLTFHFDAEKALHVIVWLARQVSDPTFHRISKLLYFADRMHLERYGRLICGDSYVAMKHGPVPSELYDMLKAVRGDGLSPHFDQAKQAFRVEAHKRVVPLQDPQLDRFSESDLECLQESVTLHGHLAFSELTNLSHDQAWDSVDENDVIDVEEIIATFPDGNALLEHLREQLPTHAP